MSLLPTSLLLTAPLASLGAFSAATLFISSASEPIIGSGAAAN